MKNQDEPALKLSKQVFLLHAFCSVFFVCFTCISLHFWQKSDDMLSMPSGSELEVKLAIATTTAWELVFTMAILVSLFSLWTAVTMHRIRKLALPASVK